MLIPWFCRHTEVKYQESLFTSSETCLAVIRAGLALSSRAGIMSGIAGTYLHELQRPNDNKCLQLVVFCYRRVLDKIHL
jgi:hypothetical protein